MKKYVKPTIVEETLEIEDIIAVSNAGPAGAGIGDSDSILDLFR